LEVTRSRCNSIKLALYLSGRTLTELDSPLLHPHRHMADFDFEPQQANHLPGDSFPRSIVRRGPQHHHTLQIPGAASSSQLEGQWEDVLRPSVTVKRAVQGTLQDPQHRNIYYPDLPERQDPTIPFIYPNQGVPEQHQVIFPENQNNHFGYAPRDDGHLVPGPSQPTVPGPSAYRAPPPGQQSATEDLRQLASRCVHYPSSQVDMVRMEPSTAGRFKVVIVLEMAGFF